MFNHRVIEVTPTDEVVWEYHAMRGPYDVERVAHGDESLGSTIRDLNASGSYPITGSANITAGGDGSVGFVSWVRSTSAGTPLEEPMSEFSTRLSHAPPRLRPVWMTSWSLFWAACVIGIGITAIVGELYPMRQRPLDAVRGLFGR